MKKTSKKGEKNQLSISIEGISTYIVWEEEMRCKEDETRCLSPSDPIQFSPNSIRSNSVRSNSVGSNSVGSNSNSDLILAREYEYQAIQADLKRWTYSINRKKIVTCKIVSL